MALVALCIVHRFKPDWAAIDIVQAAAELSCSSQRLSRLVSRAIVPFETVVGTLTRRGRPPKDDGKDRMQAKVALTLELLAVATSVLSVVGVRHHEMRALLVGAWLRIHAEHGATQDSFCKALALPERTLRSWLKQAPRPASPPSSEPDKPGKRKRPPRRGRFGFEVTLPETQIAGDTTDVRAFGVTIKLAAAQDVGGRDAALLEQYVIESEDTSEHVVEVLATALSDLAGAQCITDQGTPYMAAATREALEAMVVEHAPQKEGDPLGKATIERAFLTVKSIAEPLLELSNRIADKIPALRNTELATCTTRLTVSALLRAYQHGARAARRAIQARGDMSPDTLSRLAEESRERSVARDKSARLLLTHIHELYGIQKPVQRFVDSLRRYPIQVLRDAERAFASQVHRGDIRDRASYFAALVRRLHEEYVRDQRRQRFEREQERARDRDLARYEAQRRAWRAQPAVWFRNALEMLACHWQPAERTLLFGGQGPALGDIRASLARLVTLHGSVCAFDIVAAVMSDFSSAHADSLGPDGLRAVHDVLQRELNHPTLQRTPCASSNSPAILASLGRNPRPPPSVRLRN